MNLLTKITKYWALKPFIYTSAPAYRALWKGSAASACLYPAFPPTGDGDTGIVLSRACGAGFPF